jgi:hypothetical protein
VSMAGLIGVAASRVRRRGRKALRLVPAVTVSLVRRSAQAGKRRRHASADAREGAAAL